MNLFNLRMGSKQVLLHRDRVDLGVISMKRFSTLLKDPEMESLTIKCYKESCSEHILLEGSYLSDKDTDSEFSVQDKAFYEH